MYKRNSARSLSADAKRRNKSRQLVFDWALANEDEDEDIEAGLDSSDKAAGVKIFTNIASDMKGYSQDIKDAETASQAYDFADQARGDLESYQQELAKWLKNTKQDYSLSLMPGEGGEPWRDYVADIADLLKGTIESLEDLLDDLNRVKNERELDAIVQDIHDTTRDLAEVSV